MNFEYRKEIDGLRGLAVLAVVFFHADFKIFNGGYVGVDIFFVISGYLITTIILHDLKNKKFSIIYFYERRIRRILPALLFLILILSFVSFIFLTWSQLSSFYNSIKATLLFYSNFYFWKNTPYFTTDAELQPLLHTWSLSIEEQFYIFFPIILIILNKYIKKQILLFIFFSFLLSFLICYWASLNTGNNFNFYFTLSRLWELAIGSLVAYYLFKKKKISDIFCQIFSFIGFIFIIYSIFFFNKQTLFPGLSTLLPTIGTSLIIIFANDNSFIKKILSFKIFVWIGLISYSFYLWHQPLLAFGKIYFINYENSHKLLLISISLVISFLSWKYIEKVFRNKDKIKTRTIWSLTVSLTVIFLSLSIFVSNFFKSNSFNGTEAQLAKLLSQSKKVYSTEIDERQFAKFRIIYENEIQKTLIIGSSRAMQISSDVLRLKSLNLSVSGASIEDHIAIGSMAVEKFKPDTIILGADPWLFNKYNGQTRWKSLEEEFKLSINKIKNHNNNSKFFEFNTNNNNNYNFFERNLLNFYNFMNLRNVNYFVVNEDKNIKKSIIIPDGSRIEINTSQANAEIINYSMARYEFSNELYDIYNQYIQYLKSKSKNIVLVLSPYHPDSYVITIEKKPVYEEIEKKFKDLALKNSIRIIGSYNPKIYQCGNNEFYDNQHPKKSCIKKIIEEIK